MKLSGSIAAFADSPLPDAVQQLDRLGVDYIHVDCNDDPQVFNDMDTIRAHTHCPIDLHIISPTPEKFLPLVSRFHVEQVCFQYETAARVPDIREETGARLGMAFMLDTDLAVFDAVADKFQFLMLMATTPGKSGGTFGEDAYDKISAARRRFPGKALHVDGGVNDAVSGRLRDCGVDVVISGNFLSKAGSLSAAVFALKNGSRSNFPVRDFMQARNALPTLHTENLTLKSVLTTINKHKMGLVLIVDHNDILVGMITDGDIRRGILNNGTELALPNPADIINYSPLSVTPEHSLHEALQTVEMADRVVLFMPVLGPDRRLLGGLSLRQILGDHV
ncbi:MAG: CBS domain-containing protein [Alphaproteobacteria bacterium]|nr:CBS domain-containing protein [Alphaproteobacteria bacterium]